MHGQEPVMSTDAPISLCDLFASPGNFDRRVIHVEGVAVEAVHTAAYIYPDCPAYRDNAAQLSFVRLKKEDTRLLDEYWTKLEAQRAIRVEVIGVVHTGCRQYGPNGYPFQIDVTSIVKITALSKEFKKRHRLPE
jgi:hypothetical protein